MRQGAAVVLLALAIGAVLLALGAADRRSAIQGPGALAVDADGQAWVGFDDRLWRVGPDGRLRGDDALAVFGLAGPPQALARHPGGGIVANVRGDPTLHRLGAVPAGAPRRIVPQWPAELAPHGARAINLAVHADGRIAVATGGGHAVALFDAQGRFLARTPPDAYRFTNGLWWDGESLWTTDTNRTRLLRLDGRTLAPVETVQLHAGAAERFLGPARAHPADPARVALIRFGGDMTHGHVTQLAGRPPAEPEGQPRVSGQPVDVDWLGDAPIYTDGGSFRLWLQASATAAPQPFGSPELQARLDRAVAQREQAHREWKAFVSGAVAAVGGAALLLLIDGRQRRRALDRERPLDLSRLGTPRLDRRRRAELALVANLPFLAMLLGMALVQLVPWPGFGALARTASTLAVPLLLAPWMVRHHRRLAAQGEFEPHFNGLALLHVARGRALREALQPGEQVIEAWSWMLPTLNVAVLTDSRLLLFLATLNDLRLAGEAPRAGIVEIGTRRTRARWLQLVQGAGWLELRWADGRDLAGAVSAPTVAERVAATLAPAGAPAATAAPPAGKPPAPRRVSVVLASLLVPGLGQWVQQRPLAALLFFVPWVVIVVFGVGPLWWALDGPRREVAMLPVALVVGCALLYAAVSALDAWHMDAAR